MCFCSNLHAKHSLEWTVLLKPKSLLNIYIMFFKAPELPQPEPVVQPTAAKVTPSTPEQRPAKGIDH